MTINCFLFFLFTVYQVSTSTYSNILHLCYHICHRTYIKMSQAYQKIYDMVNIVKIYNLIFVNLLSNCQILYQNYKLYYYTAIMQSDH